MCMLLPHWFDSEPPDDPGKPGLENDGRHPFQGVEPEILTFDTITILKPLLGILGTHDRGVVILVHNSPTKGSGHSTVHRQQSRNLIVLTTEQNSRYCGVANFSSNKNFDCTNCFDH